MGLILGLLSYLALVGGAYGVDQIIDRYVVEDSDG